jgi:FkbM family methyltransferase
MSVKHFALSLANQGYHLSFPLYRLAYMAWKSVADREERRLLARFVTPGCLAVDVGANIGAYALFLSRLAGATGSILAFEPEPQNFARLQHAVRRRNNVSAIRAAVGSASGQGHLYLSGALNVDHRSYDSGEGRTRVPVDIVALDDVLDGRTVSAIKIDVQGAEVSVLSGARRTLERSAGMMLLVEVWPHGLRAAGTSASELLYSLSQLGFRLEPLQRGGHTSLEAMIALSEEHGTHFNLAAIKGSAGNDAVGPVLKRGG